PCVFELPNIQKNYELYHDRGFEVIGISEDQKRKTVEDFVAERKIPWNILFDGDYKEVGKTESLGAYYGADTLPTVYLVDKEGKVVSVNARGPELGRLLAELIGPPDASGDKKPETKESAKPEKKDAAQPEEKEAAKKAESKD